MASIRAIDLFCGAGGSSRGAQMAGVEVVAGFDMWGLAGEVYCDNFPDAWFYQARLEDIDAHREAKKLGRIDLILASPECTNHSPAKGSGPRCEKSKETAFQVIRFARAFKPRWIIIENVINMRKWLRYQEFLDDLDELGYHIAEQVMNASDFGVPQSRRRLFLMCSLESEPSQVSSSQKRPRSAATIIDPNGNYRFSPLKTPRRAKATLQRAHRATRILGNDKRFLIVYYGSDGSGGWQRVERPLRTVTTVDRFALVKPTSSGHVMRMLQVPELKAAMGMPSTHELNHGTRRDQIKMLGNGVCPPVMQAAVKKLVANA